MPDAWRLYLLAAFSSIGSRLQNRGPNRKKGSRLCWGRTFEWRAVVSRRSKASRQRTPHTRLVLAITSYTPRYEQNARNMSSNNFKKSRVPVYRGRICPWKCSKTYIFSSDNYILAEPLQFERRIL